MRVLITGGAGFIGSHVAEALLHLGHELAIVDSLTDFYDPVWKRHNLDLIAAAGPHKFWNAGIGDFHRLLAIFQEFAPDAVIHLAAKAGVRPSVIDPLGYEETNVRGTLCVLEACRQTGVARLVFASSSSVYGSSNRTPFREDELSLLPLSPYAATKLAGEKFCYTYSYLHGLHVVCLRLFTVYGPRQRPDLAIRKFVDLIAGGKPVTMYGDGSSGRDYTYVTDTVAGIVAALQSGLRFDIVNLGSSSPVTLAAMIGVIETVVGRKAIIQRAEWHSGEMDITWASIEKAASLLNYSPQVSFRQGIGNFVAWYRSIQESRPSRLAGTTH